MKYSPYSFSKINIFQECPKKFDYTYINKVPIDLEYKDIIQLKRGRFVHAYIAERLNGGSGMRINHFEMDVEDTMSLITHAENALTNEYIAHTFDYDHSGIEFRISLDDDMHPCDKSDEVIGGSVDYFSVHGSVAVLVDWKTGKKYETPDYSQLELYAIWVIEKYPDVEEIDLLFYYIEHDEIRLKTFSREQVIGFKTKLADNISIIENATEFPTVVTPRCQNCKFVVRCGSEMGNSQTIP